MTDGEDVGSSRTRQRMAGWALWSMLHGSWGGALGLLLGTLLLAAVFGLVAMTILPVNQGVPVYGRVLSMNLVPTDMGDRYVVWAEAGETKVMVGAPRTAMCQPGDRIKLMRWRTMFGTRFSFASGGCVRVR